MTTEVLGMMIICLPFMAIACYTDWKTRQIGYMSTIGILGVSLFLRWLYLPETLLKALFLSACLGLLLFLPKSFPIGGGDIKLLIAMGMLLSTGLFFKWLFLSLGFGLGLTFKMKKSYQSLENVYIPFALPAGAAYLTIIILLSISAIVP